MAEHTGIEWPAEPWLRGCEREADCIYQEGEAHPLVLVDPARVLTADEADNTLNRIVICVNALAGIDDPEAFVLQAVAALRNAGWENG